MDIVHITSELAPIAKVGGLGDVLYGLSKALVQKGHRVRIFLPKYDILDYHLIEELQVAEKNLTFTENEKSISNTLWRGKCHDLELYLIETHHPRAYFDREKIYGEEDDTDRFSFFCKVACEVLLREPPDIIHLHDWMTAFCTLFFKEKKHPKIVFTIHNLEHQGRCAPFNVERLGYSSVDEKLQDPIYDDTLNLLKGALYYSDALTVVSPTYMKEIQTSEHGLGLEKDLIENKKKLTGILNGIDAHYWNPEKDSFLVQRYRIAEIKQGKRENKIHVQEHLGLPQDENKPLVVSITRLVPQKGIDLIEYGIEKTIELGGQFVLLGSTTDPELRAQFERWKNKPQVAIRLEYDEPFSHILYAASDMLLMPSIFEPCGLSQMISLRYGSVPLVHATGGLKDTIVDSEQKSKRKPNGFVFTTPDNKGVDSVLERAFHLYRESPDKWDELVQNGMQEDFSWNVSADKYIEVYK